MALQDDAASPDSRGSGNLHDLDSPKKHLEALSSPATTPLTTSFDSVPFLSFAEHSFTPLSIFDDFDVPEVGGPAEEVGGGKLAAPMDQLTAHGPAPVSFDSADSSAVGAPDSTFQTRSAVAGSSGSTGLGSKSTILNDQNNQAHSAQSPQHPTSDRIGPSNLVSPGNGPSTSTSTRAPKHEGLAATRTIADTASPSPKDALHGHGLGQGAHDILSTHPSSDHPPPLRIGSVQPDILFAQPRPKLVRAASERGPLPLQHPTPELNSRSGAYVGNIAQLEATAERLSMTSSIEDAIRNLHTELKRSESRRSSLLAANLKANSTGDSPPIGFGLKRHKSNSSSIVSNNIAARHGYSPAAFVTSPSHSLSGRLRSSSKNSTGRPDLDTILSRHGPGKASVRSVRSTKLSLAEISEMEPVALTQDALDKADKQPVVRNDEHDALPPELKDANMPATDMFQNMMGHDDFMDKPPTPGPNSHLVAQAEPQRPGSSGSTNTFQQCQNAFSDFDGVHWLPEHDINLYSTPEEPELPVPVPAPAPAPAAVPRMLPQKAVRPQSYFDPESGQQMLYYPARVPAMLNLPPKLSSKPKAVERSNRRSQVLSVMMDNRQSRVLDKKEDAPAPVRDSWLPDPLASHRDSFMVLDQMNLGAEIRSVHSEEPVAQPIAQPVAQPEPEQPEPTLRRPQRLTKLDPDKRKSRMSRGDLPPALRASAFFDLPPSNAPEIEVKDGSAMATLDSILDASAHAPVSAFTDHNFAGKLGSEVYGKEKKRASMAPTVVLRTSHEDQGHRRKRSSFMWLGKRHSNEEAEKDRDSDSDDDGLGPKNADTRATEREALAGSDDGSVVIRVDADGELIEKDDDSDNDSYQGPPTTLLAELQLRKQRQKQRTQMNFPNGMHATLLEMDAVAETERKNRKGKRVNLAWEDAAAHMNEDDSDDEDVPLAIVAARKAGAQNVMDLNRPLGLMERRELEDNEPLSQRRARLTGQDPRNLAVHKRPSMVELSPNIHDSQPPSPGKLDDDEDEGETLADRKRRLAAKDEAENPLPRARPVSSVFSAELLSQFGDLDDKKKEDEKENTAPKVEEEETLGQRRRRLQAEREAREHEMTYHNLTSQPPPPGINSRRMNMADILGAHPKKEEEMRAEEERRRIERENRLAREREAKLAAMRSQMPTSLTGPNLNRSGGYQSGVYNNGLGGQAFAGAHSSPALHAQMYNQQNRQSTVFSAYGAPVQQPYASVTNLGALNNVGGYNGMNSMNPYGGTMNPYGGLMQPGMQMPSYGGSIDRVEQWRQGVLP